MAILNLPYVLPIIGVLILAIVGYIAFGIFRNRVKKDMSVLMVKASGELKDMEIPIVGSFLIDSVERAGYLVLDRARRWLENTNQMVMVCDERSMVPYCFGDGTQRQEYVEWSKKYINEVAYENIKRTWHSAPEIAGQNAMLGLLRTALLSVIFLAIVSLTAVIFMNR